MLRGPIETICFELDAAGVPVPEPWRNGDSRALLPYDLTLANWTEACELGFRTLVRDEIRYILGPCVVGRFSNPPRSIGPSLASLGSRK